MTEQTLEELRKQQSELDEKLKGITKEIEDKEKLLRKTKLEEFNQILKEAGLGDNILDLFTIEELKEYIDTKAPDKQEAKTSSRRTRKQYEDDFKMKVGRMAAEKEDGGEGVKVSEVAKEHDLYSSQVYSFRKLYLEKGKKEGKETSGAPKDDTEATQDQMTETPQQTETTQEQDSLTPQVEETEAPQQQETETAQEEETSEQS